MKKILLSLVALFATVSLVSALTYNVTVPAGTNECYIAGEFNGWSHEKMTKVTETTYTITIADATETSKYKYCSGPDWMFVEKPASGIGDVLDRTWVPEGDIVENWAKVYDPSVQIERADLTFKIQISTGTPTIWWWGGGIPGPTMLWAERPAMTAEGNNWFTYSFSQVDVTNGLSIQILDGETKIVDSDVVGSFKASKCFDSTGAETTCPVTAISEAAFDAAVVAANGTISADADFSIINLAGVDVTAQNGSLAAGAYIVKLANGAAQVVTLK
jgi:hypothetical protein